MPAESANGVAEEVLFRGAMYSAVGAHPVARSTVVYAVSTCATRNPALVLASGCCATCRPCSAGT